MVDWLVFANPGEIDSRLITTLGTNVKEGDSPIGYFGTGLKIAVAVVLRLGGKVAVHSGERVLDFSSKKEIIRGKEFEIVQMNGQALGFTTELGKTWLAWMAYRELWSNAKDERGPDTQRWRGETPKPIISWTQVAVQCSEMLEAHEKRHEWLLEGREPIWRGSKLEIFVGRSSAGFYHGIKVVDLPRESEWTYNLLGQHRLTEDRTMPAYEWQVGVMLAVLDECDDEEVLVDIILAGRESAEADWYWPDWRQPSAAFMSVATRLMASSQGSIQPRLRAALRTRLPEEGLVVVAASRREQEMINRALTFLCQLGHDVTAPIDLVETLGGQWILGRARNGRILLPKALFDRGEDVVAGTVLEEWLHVGHGLADESREMQDWLVNRLVGLGRQWLGCRGIEQ